MDFQDRFKGKIQKMSKDGIQAQHINIDNNLKKHIQQDSLDQFIQPYNQKEIPYANKLQNYPQNEIINHNKYKQNNFIPSIDMQQQNSIIQQKNEQQRFQKLKQNNYTDELVHQPFKLDYLNKINSQRNNQDTDIQKFQYGKIEKNYLPPNPNQFYKQIQNKTENSPKHQSFSHSGQQIISNTQYNIIQKKTENTKRGSTATNIKDINPLFVEVSNIKSYKPYDMKDYQNLKNQIVVPIKGLGPNITEETFKKYENKKKIQEFSEFVKLQNNLKKSELPPKQKPKIPSKNEVARQFALNIPKPQIKQFKKPIIEEFKKQDEMEYANLDELELKHQQFLQRINQLNKNN